MRIRPIRRHLIRESEPSNVRKVKRSTERSEDRRARIELRRLAHFHAVISRRLLVRGRSVKLTWLIMGAALGPLEVELLLGVSLRSCPTAEWKEDGEDFSVLRWQS
jgi:hypothetical protein